MIINVLKFNEKLFFFTVLLLTVVVRLRYANAPFERDEGEYAYAAWQILNNGIPYADFYNMKLPGVYYMYALVFKFSGFSVAAIRVALLGINLFSAFFIFKIGQRFEGGWMAAGVYLLLSLSYEGQGVMANCEHFVVFFATTGLYFLSQPTHFFTVLWSGVLLGVALLMKQHAAVFGLIAVLYILKNGIIEKKIQPTIFAIISFSIGYITPLSILGFFMIQKGIWDNFYFLTVEYASAYSSLLKPSLKYISNFKFIFADNMGFWLLFFTTLFFIFKKKDPFNPLLHTSKNKITGSDLVITFALSFLAVCPGWHFRPHYFQLIFPFAALVIAYGWAVWDFNIHFHAFKIPKNGIIGLSLIVSLISQWDYFFIKTPAQLMRDLYQNEFFNDTYAIGQYLRQHTAPTDKIGIYGNEPQMWFYTQRRAASAYLYTYPLLETQPFAAQMTEQYIAETEKSRPEWLIYSYISKGESNQETLKRLENWFADFSKKYVIQGVLYQKTKTESDMQWGYSPIDTNRKVLMVILKKE